MRRVGAARATAAAGCVAKLADAGHLGRASVVRWAQKGQGAHARHSTPSGALCRASRAVRWKLAMARRLCPTAAHRRLRQG